jgi:hypothetical protein
LAAINQPVKQLTAEHKGRNAVKATEKEADNLSTKISICIRACIMLITNLWTEIRLVNRLISLIQDLL